MGEMGCGVWGVGCGGVPEQGDGCGVWGVGCGENKKIISCLPTPVS